MGDRFVGPRTLRLLVPAVVVAAVAAAMGLALSLARSRDAASAPEPSASMAEGSVGRTETTEAATVTTARSSTTATVTTPVVDGPPLERDALYRWLWTDPVDLRFLWQNDRGAPYGQLQAARRALEERGETVVAITNGGIHRPDLVPSGLYVEGGRELAPLNRGSGAGNFFLKPNGVFWVDGDETGVDTTESYAAEVADRNVDAAVQSGPMLVIDSQINTAFSETSTSTHRRNAVGVDGSGRVLLIIADRPVTLWELADRCRELGAVEALYLDGTLSRLEYLSEGRPVFPNIPVATMIAVVDG